MALQQLSLILLVVVCLAAKLRSGFYYLIIFRINRSKGSVLESI